MPRCIPGRFEGLILDLSGGVRRIVGVPLLDSQTLLQCQKWSSGNSLPKGRLRLWLWVLSALAQIRFPDPPTILEGKFRGCRAFVSVRNPIPYASPKDRAGYRAHPPILQCCSLAYPRNKTFRVSHPAMQMQHRTTFGNSRHLLGFAYRE